MAKLPKPTRDVPVDRDLTKLAPQFKIKIELLICRLEDMGHDPIVFEGWRSDERVTFLHGFGRLYDDGRGVVTNARTGAKTWHRYGLAVDIISKSLGWDAYDKFWEDLRREATKLGLVSGNDWDRDGIPVGPDPDESVVDRPHVQWWIPGMFKTPSDHAWELLQTKGVEAVWKELRAA